MTTSMPSLRGHCPTCVKALAVRSRAVKRTLIFDPEAAVRSGLGHLLQTQKGFEVVGEIHSLENLAPTVAALQPDLIFLGTRGNMRVLRQTIRAIHQGSPTVKVILLASAAQRRAFLATLRMGVDGLLDRQLSVPLLREALQEIERGGTYLSADMLEQFLREYRREANQALPSALDFSSRLARMQQLTPRQIEVMRGIASGQGVAATATQLGLSRNTVMAHIRNLCGQLQLHTQLELVHFALQCGIVSVAQCA
jgi:two-component system, NarL family, nitrate/nitrite response regulator NarL